MKKLEQFVDVYEAGRGRPRKNANVDNGDELDVKKVRVPGVGQVDYIEADQLPDDVTKKITDKAKKAASKIGKDETQNSSKGRFALKPKYTEDDAITPLKKEDYNNNLKRLKMKFDADEPFFIQGEAGWGKTSVITDMARRHGRSVIIVYLDKAVATDLGGIPVPIEGKDGVAKLVNAMPEWAAYMLEHEDEDFLLFFDEMNQAMPDVMNALMPIVLENVICNIQFNNFIVGAAGNFKDENGAVNELSGPLKSRFKPLILWESGDEASWNQAFNFLRKSWGDKMPMKIIDMLNAAAQAFDNPREVERNVLKWAYTIGTKIKNGKTDKDLYDASWVLDQFERVAKPKEKITKDLGDQIEVIAEEVYKWMIDIDNYGKESDSKRKRTRNQDLIPDDLKDQIREAIERGYMKSPQVDADGKPLAKPDKRKYGVSRENIYSIFCSDTYHNDDVIESPDEINKEMLDRFINKLEADGVKFKFETDAEWKKAGMVDPNEE